MRISSQFQNVKSFFKVLKIQKNRRATRIAARQTDFWKLQLPSKHEYFKWDWQSLRKKNYLNASNKVCSPERIPKSTSAKITAAKAAITKTMTVVKSTSRRVGQTTLDTSERTCWINCNGLLIAMDRPFKVVLHIMRFAVTFNPWSHQVARSYLPNCVYLFIA